MADRIVFITMGTPAQAKRFFDSRWPGARVVSDPGKHLYRAFGLERGTLGSFTAPPVWLAGLKAIRHGVGRPIGDPLQLAGAFAVSGGAVLAADIAESSASEPDLGALASALSETRSA